MATPFTLVFLIFLVLATVVRLWLAGRHIRHVGAHRNHVPPRFAASIPLVAHQKAADYTIARARFGMLHTLTEAALLLALTLGGGLEAIHNVIAGYWQSLPYGLALIFAVMALSALVDLPFSLYRQFGIEARFGFNRITPRLFLTDLINQLALTLFIGTPVILTILWLMQVMGTLWWLYVWLFWCAFNLLALFVYPIWIAPLFNRFTPLADAAMQMRIQALLERCGFRASGLFVMDGSKRSSHGNAYFTGFGRYKRIVFFDTLLERLQPTEIEAILAHELGHFRHRHVLWRIVVTLLLTLIFLWVLGQLIDAPWFYAGLGVNAQNTALALILFFLVAPVFTFLFSPVSSMLSRRQEYEADAYAARQCDAGDLVRALVKLYEDNAATLTPDPLHSLFYDSHPPAALRIARLEAGRP